MREKWIQRTGALTLCVALLGGTAALAAGVTYKTIQVQYSGINLVVDGVPVTPRDANGMEVEPFVYNGTTYLPVRAVGEAIGKQVTWDGATQTAYIGEAPGQTSYLLEVCPPYQTHDYNIYYRCITYLASETKSFSMAGQAYTNGLTMAGCNSSNTYALFNLNGNYKQLTMTLAPADGSTGRVGVAFIVDGKQVAAYTVEKGDYPKEITVPLNYGLQLKIVTIDNSGWGTIGLGNIIIE